MTKESLEKFRKMVDEFDRLYREELAKRQSEIDALKEQRASIDDEILFIQAEASAKAMEALQEQHGRKEVSNACI